KSVYFELKQLQAAMTPSRIHSICTTNSPMMTSPNTFYLSTGPMSLTRDQQNLNFQRINFLIEDALDYLNTFDVMTIAPCRRQTMVHKADRLISKLEQI